MPQQSEYVLFVDNISSVTTTGDVEKEFAYAGKIRDIVKSKSLRCALVEFWKKKDAEYAWKKMDGLNIDGRKWKVDWAEPRDFKTFGWKWTEGPSRSPSRSRSRSRSPGTVEAKDATPRDPSRSP